MLGDVGLVLDQPVLQALFQVGAFAAGLGKAVNDVDDQVKPVEVVENGHIERGGDRPFLFVSPNVEVAVIGSSVGQPVDQPRIAVEGKDYRSVAGKQPVELSVTQTVGVL